MKHFTWQPITLLRTTWRIAHSASDQRHNVLVYVGDGVGEAAGVPELGESQAGIIQYLSTLADREWDPFAMEDMLNSLPVGSRAARAGIDIALHDLWGKRLGQSLYRLLGVNPDKIPPTSFTIAIDEPAAMAERARQSEWPVLKIKLGSPIALPGLMPLHERLHVRVRDFTTLGRRGPRVGRTSGLPTP